jgi:hypothetical protein
MLLIRKARKLLSLSIAEQCLLLKVSFWLIAMKVALVSFRFQSVIKWLAIINKPVNHQIPDPTKMQKIIRAIEISGNNMPGNLTCLPQALVAQSLLTRLGFKVDFRIGVARNAQGQLLAHAWIEKNGEIVLGGVQSLSRFTPLPPLAIKNR